MCERGVRDQYTPPDKTKPSDSTKAFGNTNPPDTAKHLTAKGARHHTPQDSAPHLPVRPHTHHARRGVHAGGGQHGRAALRPLRPLTLTLTLTLTLAVVLVWALALLLPLLFLTPGLADATTWCHNLIAYVSCCCRCMGCRRPPTPLHPCCWPMVPCAHLLPRGGPTLTPIQPKALSPQVAGLLH